MVYIAFQMAGVTKYHFSCKTWATGDKPCISFAEMEFLEVHEVQGVTEEFEVNLIECGFHVLK